MPPIVALLLFVGWTLYAFAMGMRRGRRLTQEDLAAAYFARPTPPAWSVPVTLRDEATWLHADRREVSLSL